jgi:hypothetical protein
MNGAIDRMFGEETQSLFKKLSKLGRRLLAACLGKFAMLDPSLPGDVTANFDVERRIDEDEPSAVSREKGSK